MRPLDLTTRKRMGLSPVALGLLTGAFIAYADLVPIGGDDGAMVVTALLLLAGGTAGALWGRRGWKFAVGAWSCLPLVHLVMRLLSLPDGIRPDTYGSIGLLAAFTLTVTAAGTGVGLLIHQAGSKG